MRILLCTLNARYTHLSLALRYLRNELPASADVVVSEYLITQSLVEIVRDICKQQPDVLLCSVYIWNSRHFKSLLPDIRSLLPDCCIVVGGPEVSWNPAAWLEAVPVCNLVVSGPGELAVRELAACGFDLSRWPARIMYAAVPDFTTIPQAYRTEDFPCFKTRYVYFETSRGCPFACSYCLSSNSAHHLQLKPLSQLIPELQTVLAAEPGLVKFVDRTFNADPERARQIWAFLFEQYGGAATRFHFEIHPALLSDADFSLLAQIPPGLFQFEIGVQTIHAHTRREIRRGGDWQQEKTALVRLLGLRTIHLHADLIAGLPGESLADIAESFDELVALGADHVQLGFLKVLPGTLMYEKRLDYGLIFQQEAPYEILQTRWLDNCQLILLKQLEELLDTIGNSHRYDALLAKVFLQYGGPYASYHALLDYCLKTGFDIRTRNREKVQPMLDAWAAAT